MNRMITSLILGHWLLFFLFQAMDNFAGSFPVSAAQGAARTIQLNLEGTGYVALFVSALFLWALLSRLFEQRHALPAGHAEKIAFSGGALMFSVLSALAVLKEQPAEVLAATGYFTALIMSWVATRVEGIGAVSICAAGDPASKQLSQSVMFAKMMASGASHNNLLAKIAGRERT